MDILSSHKKTTLIVSVAAFVLALYLILIQGTSAINPAENNTGEDPRAGIDYALLYNQGKIFDSLDNDEARLQLVQQDLALYARTTRVEFNGNEKLIGFTFDNSEKVDGNISLYQGYFYGVKDRYSVAVTNYAAGMVTLSITNTADGTNIDNFLNLGGKKNRFIVSLPVEADKYSIRYLKAEDKIAVTFYIGYSIDDVNTVLTSLNQAYEGEIKYEDLIFSVNGISRFDINGIKDFATSPDNKY